MTKGLAIAALAALGVSDAERTQLAAIYTIGQSLWRTPVPHFSGWDSNWGFGPPPDAVTGILTASATDLVISRS